MGRVLVIQQREHYRTRSHPNQTSVTQLSLCSPRFSAQGLSTGQRAPRTSRYIFADVADGHDKDQASYNGIQVDVEYIIPNSTWSTFELYVFFNVL